MWLNAIFMSTLLLLFLKEVLKWVFRCSVYMTNDHIVYVTCIYIMRCEARLGPDLAITISRTSTIADDTHIGSQFCYLGFFETFFLMFTPISTIADDTHIGSQFCYLGFFKTSFSMFTLNNHNCR